MNTATDLLTTAQNSGLSLTLDGEQLRVRWQGQPPPPALLADLKAHKAEIVSLLAANDHQSHHVAAQPEPLATPENQELPDRYRHLVQCQQCVNLTLGGGCRIKAGHKPLPDARRDCGQFAPVQSERRPIKSKLCAAGELDGMFERHEQQLLAHVVNCPDCRTSDRRWCAEGFAVGSVYDALLLCFEDAGARHVGLVHRVIRARLKQM